MPKRTRTINVPHFGNGIDFSADANRISSKGNVQSMNMLTDLNGAISTGLHASTGGIDWGEGDALPQGGIISSLYPHIWIVVINGKIKYANLITKVVYNFDTTVILDTSARVKMIEWRGQIYFCNGVNNNGRLTIGKLALPITTGSTQLDVGFEEGYRFNNPAAPINSGRTTVFIENDEITYTAVSGSGAGDDLTGVTGISTSHAADVFVTQYNLITPSAFAAIDLAVFKDTMFAISATENGIVRIGKTISTVGDIVAGNLHDFSDNERIIVGQGGLLSALHATETRLYISGLNTIDYITTQISPTTGALEFTSVFSFTKNYGILNPFCSTQFEDMDVVLTGSRLIRFGYAPQNDQILPDQTFDKPVLALLQKGVQDGSVEHVFYDGNSKLLFIFINMNGILTGIIRSEQTNAYSYPITLDMRVVATYNNSIYFIDSIGRTFVIDGTFNAEGGSENHQFISARIDDKNRDDKLFLRGIISGKMERLTEMIFSIFIDGNKVGGDRIMKYSTVKKLNENPDNSSGVGSGSVGGMVIGGELSTLPSLVEYEYSFLIGKRGKDIQIEISSNQSGDYWNISNLQVEYVPQQINNSIYR